MGELRVRSEGIERAWWARWVSAWLLIAAAIVVGPLATPAHALTCGSTSAGPYSVDVCLVNPLDGAALSGDTTVTASVSVTGASPGVSKLLFYTDGDYLLSDYEAPYDFVLPSDTFADGTVILEVEAVMRDSFVTNRTSVSVSFSNGVATPPPTPTGFTPRVGTSPAPGEPFVVAATGDGASGQSTSDAVVDAISAIDPNLFLYLGDVYEFGTYTEFKNWYGEGTRFGTFSAITNPTIGNHERVGGTSPGYDFYWATPPEDFSVDTNGWHIINLNGASNSGLSSAQMAWLQSDLAANTAACTIAYFHHPVVSVGPQGDNPDYEPVWAELVNGGVDIVLTGHEHSYQRWLPMDASLATSSSGATQFVMGGGGHGIQGFVRTDSRLAVGVDTIQAAYGALKLELNQDGAAFGYLNIDNEIIDSGTIQCGGTPADTTAPTVTGNVSATAPDHAQVDVAWDASNDNVGVASYSIYRDGSPVGSVPGSSTSFADNTVQPSTQYSYTVEAVDAAGNGSGQSTGAVVTTPNSSPTVTVVAEADTWIDSSNPGSNFGTASSMRIDGSPDRRGYVRFDVTGITDPIVSATLRVRAESTHATGYEAQEVTDNSWSETGMTYQNDPGFGPSLGTSGPTTAGDYTEVDVTSHVTGNGLVSFAMTPLNNTNLLLATKESVAPPELVIVQNVGGNSPPVADDQSLSTPQDVAAIWTPSVSDADPDILTCSINTNPSNGTATVATDCSSGTYTPDPGTSGPDSFTYEVSDGILSDTGLVSVTVVAGNTAPVADPGSASTVTDTPVSIGLTGSDADGDCPLTFAIDSSPSAGSLGPITNVQCTGGVANAEVDYTPNPGVTGTDSFGFTVTDPSGATSPAANIAIDISAPSPTLTFDAVGDAYVDANSPDTNRGSSSQMRVDGDPERLGYAQFDVSGISGTVTSATLRVYANSNHSTGYEVQAVAASWSESIITYNNAPAYGPVLGASGPTSSGSYNEIDVTGHVTGAGIVSVALTPLNNTNMRLATSETANPPQLVVTQDLSGNNPPSAGDVNAVTDEDVATNWSPNASDPDPDILTCSILALPTNGSATVAADCSSGTYTPDPEYSGPDSFTYEVSDGSLTDSGTVAVTVNAVNDPPTAGDRSVTTTADTPVTIMLSGADVDGDCPLAFSIGGGLDSGTLGAISNVQCASGSASADVTYTPNGGFTGSDQFTYLVTDPSGAVAATAGTISISVDPAQTTFVFEAVADAYVDANSANTNRGSSSQLRVDGSPERLSYLRFDVQGLPGSVVTATLRIYAQSNHSAGFEVEEVADNTWDEGTIMYNNAPLYGPPLGLSGRTTSNTWMEIPVTGFVSGNGLVSFVLTPLNNTNLRLSSREGSNPPQLVIDV